MLYFLSEGSCYIPWQPYPFSPHQIWQPYPNNCTYAQGVGRITTTTITDGHQMFSEFPIEGASTPFQRASAPQQTPLSDSTLLPPGFPSCRQGMGGMAGVYSSPNACQQKGLYMWYCGTTRGFSCIPARLMPEHGEASLHAKWAGLIVKVPLMFSY
jgi:hypothetical protein